MTRKTYSSTPPVRRLTPENGGRAELVGDQHGRVDVIVAVRSVRAGPTAIAIAGEDRVIGMRHRTDEDRLILPRALSSESRAVWFRDGRCEGVLAELFEPPENREQGQ